MFILYFPCIISVEAFSSMLNIGLGFGFLPGMFYDKFGPQWTSFLGLLVSVPAYILLWSTSRYVHFYSSNSWLMAIYFFMCGTYPYVLELYNGVPLIQPSGGRKLKPLNFNCQNVYTHFLRDNCLLK